MDGRCPAEVYEERESACRVMLGLFETQEDCARFHNCPARRCAIDGRWPEAGKAGPRPMSKAAQFIGVAYDGPRPPEDSASGGRS